MDGASSWCHSQMSMCILSWYHRLVKYLNLAFHCSGWFHQGRDVFLFLLAPKAPKSTSGLVGNYKWWLIIVKLLVQGITYRKNKIFNLYPTLKSIWNELELTVVVFLKKLLIKYRWIFSIFFINICRRIFLAKNGKKATRQKIKTIDYLEV